MANEKILLIDDSQEILEILSTYLTSEGYEVETASDGLTGISMIGNNFYDIVLTDIKMPDVGGMDVLAYTRENSPESICLVLTGYGTIKSAVEAIKAGAFDYFTKPVKLDEIQIALERALEHRNLKRENIYLRNQLKREYRFENIIGDSEPLQKVFERIEKVADTDSTVLILGESGTGKELIAKAIHYNSYRKENPFIPVNCAAIPSELLESELFGHEKGAFTNAIRTRIGRFELANRGTLFLDEIGDMNLTLQSKLLRVLQERQFERIGGMKPIRIDIRIIAATHQNLKKAVEQKRFREDLYYRLNVIPIELPSLRERKTDIPLLVHHFIQQSNEHRRKKVAGIADEVMQTLTEYDWPGNVRELENMVERMIILTNHEMLTVEDLPEKLLPQHEPDGSRRFEIPEGGLSLETAINEFERQLILQALDKTGWVKNRAAELLHLNRTTLIEKIKRQNLTRSNS